MQKNLSAVYSGEYTQWNTQFHSLQVMLFMYKQMQDQGIRLGDVLLTRAGIFKNT